MTESTINVISVQQGLQDLSDVRDLDRYDLLTQMAKETKQDKETMLAFDEMYYDYTPFPSVKTFTDILLRYVLLQKKYTPTIKMDLDAQGNTPWAYFIPKEIPEGVVRTTLPVRKRVIVEYGSEKPTTVIIPEGQLVDIIKINNKDVKKFIKSLFLTSEYVSIYSSQKNKNLINCNKIKESRLLIDLKPIKLDPNYNGFLKSFKDFNIFRDNYYFEESFVSDIIRLQLRQFFIEYIEDYNIPEEAYTKILNEKKNTEKYVALTKEKNKNIVTKSIYINIIRNNFQDKYRTTGRLSSILSELPKDVRKYVDDEYTKKTTFIQATVDNKCPHVKIYKDMNKKVALKDKARLLRQLEPFMANRNERHKFITCNKCNFDIICPHLYKFIKLQIDNRAGMSIRRALEMYIDPLIDNHYISYCKICHEDLFESNYDEIETEFTSYKVIYSELYKFTWSKCLEIFTTLKFNPKISPYDFGNYIVFSMFPIFIKSKHTLTNQEINVYVQKGQVDPLLKVIVLCYIYGYLLNVIRAYIADPSTRFIKITLDEGISSRNVSKYAEAFLRRFEGIHRPIFNQVGDVNIQELFLEIYTYIAKEGKNFSIETTSNTNALVYYKIINNTTFLYALHIANLLNYVNMGLKPTVDEFEKLIEKVLGKTVSSIVHGHKQFNYSDIYIPKEGPTNVFDNNLSLNNIRKAIPGRIIRNYQIYIKGVLDEERDIESLLKKEKIFYYYSLLLTSYCEFVMTATKNYKPPIETTDPSITALYNENGKPHVWDILVYDDGQEKKVGSPIHKYIRIVDYKSSTENILRSNTYKLNKEKTLKAYLENEARNIFFKFYHIRCPEEGIHKFQDGICSKCKYEDGSNSDAYYKKYKKIYEDERNKLNKAEKEKYSDLVSKKISSHTTRSNWSYNVKPIIEVSKLISIPNVVIESIGAMENRSVSEIYSGTNRCPLPEHRYSIQLALIMSHYRNTLSIYNQIRADKVMDGLDFTKFLKKYNIPPSDVSSMMNFLPENLYDKYNELIDQVSDDPTKSPADIYNVYLESICNFILDLSKINDKSKTIAVFLMMNIIRQELSTAISSGEFDRTVLRRKNNMSLDVTEKTNIFDSFFEEEVDKDDLFDFNNSDVAFDAN